MADKLSLDLKYGSGMNEDNKPSITSGTIYFDTAPDISYQNVQALGGMYVDLIDANGDTKRYTLVPAYNQVIKYNEDTNTIILE